MSRPAVYWREDAIQRVASGYEAKESVKVEAATRHFATITLRITLECIINLPV